MDCIAMFGEWMRLTRRYTKIEGIEIEIEIEIEMVNVQKC